MISNAKLEVPEHLKCKICGKEFICSTSVLQHTRHHYTPIRQFCGACRRCGKVYKVPYCLKAHENQCSRIEKISMLRDAAGETDWTLLQQIPQIRIPVYLLPHPSMPIQDRMRKYHVNESIQCRKICEYVLNKVLGQEVVPGSDMSISNSLQNSSQNDANSKAPNAAENRIQLLCKDIVCHPNMELRMVRHFFWKQATDLTFHYKLKPTTN